MMRSLFSGVTGLRSHQTKMDVIGNNIANVNTTGFKKSVVTFKDLYSQTISNAAGATGSGAGSTGGVNARQIGLGSTVGAIATVHTPGSAQYTGNSMDVAISGDGYFTLQTTSGYQYSRSGNFYTDTVGNLVNETGYYVMTVKPISSGTANYALDEVVADGMVSGSIAAPSAGSIRSGNVTAELETVMNKQLGFKFIPDDTANIWQGSVLKDKENCKLNGSIISATPTGTNKYEVDLNAIKDYMVNLANADPENMETGVKDISFKYEGDQTAGTFRIKMLVGDTVIADTDISTFSSGTTKDLVFTALDGSGKEFASMTLTTTSVSLSPVEVGEAFDKVSVSTVTMKEAGAWYVVDMDSNPVDKIERVSLATESTVDDFVPAGSEIQITTPTLGTFRLKVTDAMKGNTALSKAMENSSFLVNVKEEYTVSYSSPPDVVQSDLKSLTVDFTRYNNISIDPAGAVIGQLTRAETVTLDDGTVVDLDIGDKVVLGYIPLAAFNNPAGLEKVSDNMFVTSANSGAATYGTPGSGAVGSLTPSNLEMSNVDLSEEMVNMIITQRGFQANSRIISTTDTMLEELVNLKR